MDIGHFAIVYNVPHKIADQKSDFKS